MAALWIRAGRDYNGAMTNGLQRVYWCTGVVVFLLADAVALTGCAQSGAGDGPPASAESSGVVDPSAAAALSGANGPGPFGLAMGMSRDEIETAIGISLEPSPSPPFHFTTPLVPRPLDGVDSYTLTVSPELGLCHITVAGENVSTSADGLALRTKYDRLRNRIAGVYGEYDEIDSVRIWDEPGNWMRAVAEGERELSATWSAAAGSTMRNNVLEVRLYAQALRIPRNTGYLLLTYDFYNSFDCLLEWLEAEKQEAEAARQADEGVF